MKAPDDRWCKGKYHCIIITVIAPKQKVGVRWDDGTQSIVDIRQCWRWKKESLKS